MGIIGIYLAIGLVVISLIDLSDYLYPDATEESIDNWDRIINLSLWPLVIFIFARALIKKFLGE